MSNFNEDCLTEVAFLWYVGLRGATDLIFYPQIFRDSLGSFASLLIISFSFDCLDNSYQGSQPFQVLEKPTASLEVCAHDTPIRIIQTPIINFMLSGELFTGSFKKLNVIKIGVEPSKLHYPRCIKL